MSSRRDAYPHSVTLDILEGTIHVICRYEACAMGIADYYSSAVTQRTRTPDVLIQCDLENPDRVLFRSRPPHFTGPLSGISFRSLGRRSFEPWTFLAPPLPPFPIEPFANRFVGFHAALLEAPNGDGVLIVGDRGSGKTTLSIALQKSDYRILTDETACVVRRTSIATGVPRPLGVWNAQRGHLRKTRLASSVAKVCAEPPVAIRQVIALRRGPSTMARPLRPHQAAQALLQQLVDVGSTHDESMVTVARLVETVPTAELSISGFEDLAWATDEVKGSVGLP